YRPLFPRLPERTRLFRLLKTHQDWTRAFLAAPTVLGVIDTYGIELIHPIREGRSPQQIGRKGFPGASEKFCTLACPIPASGAHPVWRCSSRCGATWSSRRVCPGPHSDRT